MKNKRINWDWTPTKKIEKYYSDNFYKIFSFFILHCPIKNTSKMAKDLNERNISSNSLCNMIKKELDNWETSQVNEIENLLKGKNVFESVKTIHNFAYHTEYISNTDDPKKPIRTKTKGFFYSIRCSMAHGDFSIHTNNKKKFYMFQNIGTSEKQKSKIKGRILLAEDTLLKIIDIVENWDKYKKEK